jgi:hypothetical protein
MRVNGVWVGWGLGDFSSTDMTVKNFKAFARRMYKSYMGHLDDTNIFDQQTYEALVIMQDRLQRDGHLTGFIRGVLDLPTQYASGFKKRAPAAKPVIFTVEGHLSDMWQGPCAETARVLESQGVCRWQPVGYDCAKLPFNNKSGVDELRRLLNDRALLPEGTAWGIVGFSQGAMITSDFMANHVLKGELNWRLKDFKRGLAFGNPRRERNKCCDWASDPPDPDTQGIMDVLFNASTTAIADKWVEHAADGDMFAENTTDSAGRDKTAIAKIITENSWFGGPAAIFARVLALFSNLPAEGFAAIKALISAIMFLASNPNPHYSTFATPGDIEWMRGVRS